MCFILYSKYNSLKNVFLFICLILFTASFPTIYLIKNINNFVTWYTYLNVIEYFSSTSWLLGFLSIGILTYFFTTQKNTGHVALTNFYFISKSIPCYIIH